MWGDLRMHDGLYRYLRHYRLRMHDGLYRYLRRHGLWRWRRYGLRRYGLRMYDGRYRIAPAPVRALAAYPKLSRRWAQPILPSSKCN